MTLLDREWLTTMCYLAEYEKMCGHHRQGGEKMLPEVVAEEVSVQLWEILLLSPCGLTTSSQTLMVGLSGEI